MDVGDRDSYGREIASIKNLFVVERFGILYAGTDHAEIDIDGPSDWRETPNFAEAGRIWNRWIKEATCGTARIYRVRHYYDRHGDWIGAQELAVKDNGPRSSWIEHEKPNYNQL